MRARDVMTTAVATVGEDTPVEEVARVLLERRVSGVPVVDADGALIGIVSEGDLMRRAQSEAARPSSWWLRLIAVPDEATAYLHAHGRVAGDVMTRRVFHVDEDTPLAEIVDLLERKRIKRVPVVRDGRVVGIVSRANLLHGLATTTPAAVPAASADDRSLRDRILAEMTEQADVDPLFLNVTVSDGAAHLWGLVNSDSEKRAARLVAENTPGIRAVHDHLDIVPPHLRGMMWT
jgi:CBS domain-containing protein